MSTAREAKWCPRCERDLPRDAFGGNRATGDGLASYCRACKRAYDAAYAQGHARPRSYEYEYAEPWSLDDRIASIAARNRADGWPAAFEG